MVAIDITEYRGDRARAAVEAYIGDSSWGPDNVVIRDVLVGVFDRTTIGFSILNRGNDVRDTGIHSELLIIAGGGGRRWKDLA